MGWKGTGTFVPGGLGTVAVPTLEWSSDLGRDPSLCLLQEGAAVSQATNSYPALPPKEPKLVESAIPMFSTKCHRTSCQDWNFSLDLINLCVRANNHICVTS